jgi:hypothetical protein
VIFSRKREDAGRRPDAEPVRGGRHTREQAQARQRAAAPQAVETPAVEAQEFGPYDATVAPDDGVDRLDLGALRIPSLPGVGIQMEAAPSGQILRVQLKHEGSMLQLGAFAAPRSEGIWDEVREELRAALGKSGAKVAEVEGEYGPQIAARLGANGPNPVEVRHIGIDGPRWFLHAVFVGAAAVDPDRAGPLRDALRGLVVDRGVDARPVKEALPLRLPPQAAAQFAEMVAAQGQKPGQGAGGPSSGGAAPAATRDANGTARS